MSKVVLTLEAATAALAGVTELNDIESVRKATGTLDIESIKGAVDVTSMDGLTLDAEQQQAGMLSVLGALAMAEGNTATIAVSVPDRVKMLPDLESFGVDTGLDLEAFDAKNPNILKPFAYALSANTVQGDPGLDLMFPTVNVPSNVEGVFITMPYGLVKSKFNRDDITLTGETRLNERSILTGLRNPSTVNSEANLLVPVSNVKNDPYLDNDFETANYKHPTTGELITTAPIKFDAKFDLTTVAHTDKLVSEGVFADETNLDVGGHIVAIFGNLGTDKLKFDISSLPMNEITGGPSGDSQDLLISISTEKLILDPAEIKQYDGTVTAVLSTIPAGLKLVYALDINGAGNMRTCDFGIRKPTLRLLAVVDSAGTPLDTTVPGDAQAAAVIGEQLELTSYELYQTVTNSDLRIIANTIDVGERGQRIGIPYNALTSFEGTILTDKKPAVAENLLALATITSLIRKRDQQLTALKTVIYNAGTFVNGGSTKALTSIVLTPYNKEEVIDLAATLDSRQHGERGDDIGGLIAGKIESIIPAMIFDTNYAGLTTIYGQGKPGVGVVFGSDILPFMPKEIILPGVEVRMAMSEVSELRSSIHVFPIDLNHNESTARPLNFGLRFAKPDLVVTGVFNKIQGTFIVPRAATAVMVDILHTFNITNIQAALGKIA